jgi:leucyl-tRNA synthetase
MNDLRWYGVRTAGGEGKRAAVDFVKRHTLERIALMTAPVMPHIAEELWEMLGNERSSWLSASWPSVERQYLKPELEMGEEVVKNTHNDIAEIIELTKKKPKKIYLYVAPEWKRKACSLTSKLDNPSQILPTLMKDTGIKSQGKVAVDFAGWLSKHMRECPTLISAKDEYEILKNATGYLSSQFNAEIIISEKEKPDYDQAKRASKSIPMKPAIYLE